jgi:hypothetical protein
MRVQVLIDYLDEVVRILVEAGAPAETIVDALKVVTTRTELLHGGTTHSLRKLGEVANRLKALAEGQNDQPPLTADANHPVMAEEADLLRRVADIMQEQTTRA